MDPAGRGALVDTIGAACESARMKLVLALVLVAACGSKSPTPAPQKPAEGEHHQMSPELAKFHDVLSPRWHADKGPKRMTDTCGAIAEFQAAAAPLGKDLIDAVTALDGTCKANDATAFEPAFEKVHTTFHQLMEGKGEHHHSM
jgi:hypothetical protein